MILPVANVNPHPSDHFRENTGSKPPGAWSQQRLSAPDGKDVTDRNRATRRESGAFL